jgi:uncharacterized protein YrrD
MQKASDVVGRAIVSSETGERIGRVADLLMDTGSARVVGLVVGGGVLKSEQVVPYADVQTLGGDAVVARTAAGVIGARQWREEGTEATRSSTLKHRRVLTTTGRALGAIDDVYVDEVTGDVAGFELVGSGVAGLVRRRTLLPQSSGITIGADAVLVTDEAMAAMEKPS